MSEGPATTPHSTTPWALRPGRSLALDRPRVMAIINSTPDSFSDGGLALDPEHAAARAHQAVAEGADLLDIGGESTKPGSARVNIPDQIARVVPAIRAIRDAGIDAPITIDTTRAAVAESALDAGADAINDVSGGTEDPQMLPLAAERRVGVILMHRLRTPEADSYSDQYKRPPDYPGGVVHAVRTALAERFRAATAAGIAPEAVVLDPGLGFGKTVEQNLALIHGTPDLVTLGRPLLGAASRKSFVARVQDPELDPDRDPARPAPPTDRLEGSLALAVVQLTLGIRLFRVHDVRAHRRTLDAAFAVDGGFPHRRASTLGRPNP
ncbi:MAG: dihydropteroate synthase [Planctomycetota bacterium]